MYTQTKEIKYTETRIELTLSNLREALIAYGVDPLILPQEMTKGNTRLEIEEICTGNGRPHQVGLVLTTRY